MPILFLTVNPNPTHSPMFQVIFGDLTVNLDERFPVLVSTTECALQLAKDPVAAADFFDFSITVSLNSCLVGTSIKAEVQLREEF